MHAVVHGRTDIERFHVRGIIEEGTTTTPCGMVVSYPRDIGTRTIDAVARQFAGEKVEKVTRVVVAPEQGESSQRVGS